MNEKLSALWSYRGFILGSVKRKFQSKYRNSLLGAASLPLKGTLPLEKGSVPLFARAGISASAHCGLERYSW